MSQSVETSLYSSPLASPQLGKPIPACALILLAASVPDSRESSHTSEALGVAATSYRAAVETSSFYRDKEDAWGADPGEVADA